MIKENTPSLETERLILRKFNASDVNDILLLYSDKEVNKFLPWFPIITTYEATEYLTKIILPQYIKEIAYSYAIILRETNRAIGYIHINDIGGANDIGYAVRKEYWNMGIVTEACAAVTAHLREVNFPFITATHDTNNPSSGEVMKKLGMKYKYSYVELWQPKNIKVTFRMYQIDLTKTRSTYDGYWQKYAEHFIEKVL